MSLDQEDIAVDTQFLDDFNTKAKNAGAVDRDLLCQVAEQIISKGLAIDSRSALELISVNSNENIVYKAVDDILKSEKELASFQKTIELKPRKLQQLMYDHETGKYYVDELADDDLYERKKTSVKDGKLYHEVGVYQAADDLKRALEEIKEKERYVVLYNSGTRELYVDVKSEKKSDDPNIVKASKVTFSSYKEAEDQLNDLLKKPEYRDSTTNRNRLEKLAVLTLDEQAKIQELQRNFNETGDKTELNAFLDRLDTLPFNPGEQRAMTMEQQARQKELDEAIKNAKPGKARTKAENNMKDFLKGLRGVE